ncbi:hypothetical protein [Lacticaseibacillus manihotivorans]|uniref:hypothetical protein n=1 Tax=Lacticaseibacillus manihotivorans TaxID=88233 RepID=UPI0006D04943|nr:hypothetical protein [Lacticaseibacillus manihotivorans]
MIRTGKANLNAEPIDLRLKPTQEATTSLAKHWHADIVWTVAQKKSTPTVYDRENALNHEFFVKKSCKQLFALVRCK